MKKQLLALLGFLILVSSIDYAQEVTVKDNAGNSLLRIVDEGNYGAIQLKNGTPSIMTNKIYSVGNKLYYNGEELAINGSDTSSGWQDNGSNVVLRSSTDNVGIGDTNPQDKLSVNGTIGVTGFKMSNGATSGYVLTSDANGIGTWQASASGSGSDNDWTVNGNDMYSTPFGKVGIGTQTPQAKLHVNDINGFLFEGTFGSGTNINVSDGSKMIWYPKKAAIRAGYTDAVIWDNSNIGDYSTAIGFLPKASGIYSVSLGRDNDASDTASVAFGKLNTASGSYSTAFGVGTTASGRNATSMGDGTTASGQYSTSMNSHTNATGESATAMGSYTTASGKYSVAMGYNTVASGDASIAIGRSTKAEAFASTAIGMYNIGGGNPIANVSNNPVFEIGNGTFDTPSNALTVLRNGRIGIGTATPTELLDVNGTAKMTGFSMSTGATDGYVLTSDASGNGTWQSATLLDNDWTLNGSDIYSSVSGNVGIGTSSPTAKLHVKGGDGVLFEGYSTGNIPAEGAGTRMMWYSGKSAFRAGSINGNQWDDINIGQYSTALGFNTTASGESTTAMGEETIASAKGATALGSQTTASGQFSTAMGSLTSASGNKSTAMGYSSEASGEASTALGYFARALGDKATALGDSTTASGYASTAMGFKTRAKGNYSTTIGSFVTANGVGTLMIGDKSVSAPLVNNANNRFVARFSNGYRFYTDAATSIGVKLDPGANSWSTISDSTKKENFKPIDGNTLLDKISKFKLTTWNYIGQNPAKYRHYGPMAQDFYSAFGNDGIGTIGNDTTIASADFDGINFTAIHALEKNTRNIQHVYEKLIKQNIDLEAKIQEILERHEQIANENIELRNIVHKLTKEKKDLQNSLIIRNQLQQEVHKFKKMVTNLLEANDKETIRITSAIK